MSDIKGLDDFSQKYLTGDMSVDGQEEYIQVGEGQKASEETLQSYYKDRQKEFIQRAGNFTEDLVAFIVEQKHMRSLSDKEAIFSIALANINLRNAYGQSQGKEKDITPARRNQLLKEFDEICWGAQQYWDANANTK